MTQPSGITVQHEVGRPTQYDLEMRKVVALEKIARHLNIANLLAAGMDLPLGDQAAAAALAQMKLFDA